MADTLELLESIGQDATMRHASAEELSNLLELAQASEALTAAATSGDVSLLLKELGLTPNLSPQVTQNPGHEEEEEEEEPLEAPAPEASD
jgi:hypothetical protein